MDEERQLAGRMAGVMFVTGGVTAVLLLLLPGVEDAHWKWVVAIGSACVAFGVVCLVARDMSATVLCHHVPAAGSLAAAAGVTAATGGAGSPARFYVIFVLVYVAHYFSRDEALLYLPACLAVALSPLAYDDSAADGGYLGELLVICPAYVIVAGLIMDGKRLLVDARERARSLSLSTR